jgi:hypothetical protein
MVARESEGGGNSNREGMHAEVHGEAEDRSNRSDAVSRDIPCGPSSI